MIVLVFNSILLGVGLAMDAFSVSLASGLREPHMKGSRSTIIAGVFAAFQTLMPLIGWVFVHFAAEKFEIFNKFIPYIALALLLFIGGKMIYEGLTPSPEEDEKPMTPLNLFIMGVATSIDALSVGFTTSGYNFTEALISSVIIGVITFIICFIGIILGKKIGTKISKKATVLGGCILVAIGLEIFITGILG